MGTINLPVRHMHSHSFAQWTSRYHWIDYHIKHMMDKPRVVIYLLQTEMVRDHPEYHNLNKMSQTLAAKQHQKSKQHRKKEESKITHQHCPAAADRMTNHGSLQTDLSSSYLWFQRLYFLLSKERHRLYSGILSRSHIRCSLNHISVNLGNLFQKEHLGFSYR